MEKQNKTPLAPQDCSTSRFSFWFLKRGQLGINTKTSNSERERQYGPDYSANPLRLQNAEHLHSEGSSFHLVQGLSLKGIDLGLLQVITLPFWKLDFDHSLPAHGRKNTTLGWS